MDSRKPTYAETISDCERRIASYGPGPHSEEQLKAIAQTRTLLERCRAKLAEQSHIAATGPATMIIPAQTTQQNRPLINLTEQSPATITFTAGGSTTSSQIENVGLPSNSTDLSSSNALLDRQRLNELVSEVDPFTQLDADVQEVLLHVADDFIDQVATAACQLAKHRGASTLETKDVALVLEKYWDIWVPGYSDNQIKAHKTPLTAEAHKARMALIKRTSKR